MARFAFTEEWMSLRASHILPYLSQQHEIHYISSGSDVPKADFASVTLFKFPRYQQQNSLHIAAAARKLYRQGAIDFVVDYSYMAWALGNIPFVEISGGLYHNDFWPKWNRAPWYRRPRLSIGYLHYCLPERSCLRKARHIITDNAINAETIHTRFDIPEDRIAIIPNGVDEAFSRIYQTKDFSWPMLLFVGNLHLGKGILPVLEQFAQRKDLPVEFIICGDGPLRAQIETLAAGDARIKYRGRVSREEVLELHKRTTIFVFPSLAEGCPNALLEAMASGHACITYDVPTVSGVIKKCGCIASANNATAVIEHIDRLVKDNSQVKKCSDLAHERSNDYSWSECAFKTGGIISNFSERLT